MNNAPVLLSMPSRAIDVVSMYPSIKFLYILIIMLIRPTQLSARIELLGENGVTDALTRLQLRDD